MADVPRSLAWRKSSPLARGDSISLPRPGELVGGRYELLDQILEQAKSLARESGVPVRDLVILELTHVVTEERSTQYRLPDLSFGGDGLVDGLQPPDSDEIMHRAYEGRST